MSSTWSSSQLTMASIVPAMRYSSSLLLRAVTISFGLEEFEEPELELVLSLLFFFFLSLRRVVVSLEEEAESPPFESLLSLLVFSSAELILCRIERGDEVVVVVADDEDDDIEDRVEDVEGEDEMEEEDVEGVREEEEVRGEEGGEAAVEAGVILDFFFFMVDGELVADIQQQQKKNKKLG